MKCNLTLSVVEQAWGIKAIGAAGPATMQTRGQGSTSPKEQDRDIRWWEEYVMRVCGEGADEQMVVPSTARGFINAYRVLGYLICEDVCGNDKAVRILVEMSKRVNITGHWWYANGQTYAGVLSLLRQSIPTNRSLFVSMVNQILEAMKIHEQGWGENSRRVMWLLIVEHQHWVDHAFGCYHHGDMDQKRILLSLITFRTLQRWKPVVDLKEDLSLLCSVQGGVWVEKMKQILT